MASFQIPGLGFAQPNESLPPVTTESTNPPVASTATPTLDQSGAVPPPNDATPAPAGDSSNDIKDGDMAMGETHTNETPQQATKEVIFTGDQDSMDIEQAEPANTTQSVAPTTNDTKEDTSLGGGAGDEGTKDSMDVEPAETTQPTVPPTDASPVVSGLGDNSRNDAPAGADPMKVDQDPNGASIIDDLEAALGGLAPPAPPTASLAPTTQQQMTDGQGQEEEAKEWESDSSPYESSSESSSDDSSEADSDDDQFNGMDLREAARMLMDAEDGSDDEGGGGQASRAHIRTMNELPEEVIPKPEVTITPEMKIEEVGVVQHIVDTTIVIKAATPGEYQVIDTGSVLCTGERVVIGALADVLGKVQEPVYTVRFSSPEEVTELGLEVGTKVFYSVEHANYVFTQALKNLKGSDASNRHDEEVGEDEAEFSDDEKEAAYKRSLKQKRREKSGAGEGRGGRGGAQRGPHPLRQEVGGADAGGPLNYDDEDGPYKPLARPPGYGASGFSEVSEEPMPGSSRGRGGRGGGGGVRGGRGQQRARGRGRGGPAGSGGREGYSLPPQDGQYQQAATPPQYQQPPQQYQQYQQPPPVVSPPAFPQQPGFNFAMPPPFNQMFGQGQGGQNWGQAPPPFPSLPQNPSAGWAPQQGAGQGAGAGVNSNIFTPQVLSILSQYQAQMAAQGQNQNQNQNQNAPWGGPQDGHRGGYGGQ
ncbi:uncharacterized protein DNG_01464 [Cephalotrichum gorgonifer]|uniref:H/ACA ribonucleoprotein complex non-core subunit NAF1 n=1 Tax=Cephalotrichum gorgonifer TaxID=2041049 RepID=A0AAE8SRP3_9PEZI|nr:uncharacterized protein DNG_01464 [Cephalotrichum gorgonifer]